MCAGSVVGPAARVGVFTEPKPRTRQHPELKASAEEHGQLILRPAAGLPHVGVIHSNSATFSTPHGEGINITRF